MYRAFLLGHTSSVVAHADQGVHERHAESELANEANAMELA
jgi:hypothetical protein